MGATSAAPRADRAPVARVLVDTPLAHLDRPFDYAVPAALDAVAVPGVRVRVRLAGRRTTGFLLDRGEASEHTGRLSPLEGVVSPEPVLSPGLASLAAAVAARWAGTVSDVLRVAVPPRHARAEAAPAPDGLVDEPPSPPDAAAWAGYEGGAGFLERLAGTDHPRAVWTAAPGPRWPQELAVALQACLAGGRGVVAVLPDARAVARLDAALVAVLGPGRHVVLTADAGPEARYRRWLALRRGHVRAVVGTRAAVFAPVPALGLLAVWDDGSDTHVEPHAPGWNVRDVAALRAWSEGAALLVGGHAPSVAAHALADRGFARAVAPGRPLRRERWPRVEVAGTADARDPSAAAARLPAVAWRAAREALSAGLPVCVQVPRAGYVPALACTACRAPARCGACSGPLALPADPSPQGREGRAAPACGWCGQPAPDHRCAACGAGGLRAAAVGSARTAEELGRAFPGTRVVRSGGGVPVVAEVPGTRPALVVATPGAEPVAGDGYGAVLLLDGDAVLARPRLTAGEEALRRWTAAAALALPAPVGRVVVVASQGAPSVQALVRGDPGGAAAREAAERAALGFPPAARLAAVDGPPGAARALVDATELPSDADVLGPVEVPDGWGEYDGPDGDLVAGQRLLVRVPATAGAALARALKDATAVVHARRDAPGVRVRLDPLDVG